MPNVHTCPHCGRDFKRPEHLRRHCRTHTKEKPFVCFCGAAFTRTDLLRRHEKLTHLVPLELNSIHAGESSTTTLPETDHLQNSMRDMQIARSSVVPSTDAAGASEVAYDDFTFIDPMNSFEAFVQGMELPPEFVTSPISLNICCDSAAAPGNPPLAANVLGNNKFGQNTAGPLPFSRHLHSHGNGLTGACKLTALEITGDDIKVLEEGLRPFRTIANDFALPSLRTFMRYMDVWRTALSRHFPVIHFPTFRLGNCIPELILAMAALGAVQALEEQTSKKLYKAARAVALERFQVNRLDLQPQTDSSLDDISRTMQLQSAQALVFLLIYSTWARDASVVTEGFELHEPILQYVRTSGFAEHDNATQQNWTEWALSETERRISFLAFCFFNIHTIIYNRPPFLFSREIHLRLPCSVGEWQATDEQEWAAYRQANPFHLIVFKDALESLVTTEAAGWETLPCAFGNLILLHGVLQRIYLQRQLSFGSNLGDNKIHKIHLALSSWASIWQRVSGSDLHPNSEHGPIPFTSVAFLTLAYVRTHLDIGPHLQLASRDPKAVASALLSIAPLPRHSNLTSALLHAVHALSLPVAFGIEHVARSQSILWCCQHAVCAIECAIFLSKWLETIATTQMSNTLEPYERHILLSVESVIKEAIDSADWEHTDTSSWCQGPRNMSIAVLKVWSKIFSEKSSWAITVHISECLNEYTRMYERSF
ncbi:fungal-specific transcription factor domain-containing protein [Trichoderma velutinum]